MDIEYMINSSLCRHCENRVSRVVSVEGLFVQYDDEESDDFEELENFIHESCLVLCIELDHIVLECNKFKEVEVSNNPSSLLVNPEIINDLT